MAPASWQEWVAWGGIVLPLGTLAWAAIWYVLVRRDEAKHQVYLRFFSAMEQLGGQQGSIAAKVAAAYELRKFPEYREVIVRVCEKSQEHVVGPSAQMLIDELVLTANAMKANNA